MRFRREPMAYYRLYLMDGSGAHVRSFVEIDAETEDDASSRAEAHAGPVSMELWCGRKMVRRWPAELAVKSSPCS